MAYPVSFSVRRPEKFRKSQAVLWIGWVVVVWYFNYYGLFGGFAVWFFAMLASSPMLLAATLIKQKGAERYLAEAEQGPIIWLRHVMGFFSFMSFASDKFPAPQDAVDLTVRPSGTPTYRSACLRGIQVIPHAVVLVLLGIIFLICQAFAAIAILVSGTYPEWAAKFIRGYLRWTARVLVYMASLVDEYPPFSFDTGDEAALPEAPA